MLRSSIAVSTTACYRFRSFACKCALPGVVGSKMPGVVSKMPLRGTSGIVSLGSSNLSCSRMLMGRSISVDSIVDGISKAQKATSLDDLAGLPLVLRTVLLTDVADKAFLKATTSLSDAASVSTDEVKLALLRKEASEAIANAAAMVVFALSKSDVAEKSDTYSFCLPKLIAYSSEFIKLSALMKHEGREQAENAFIAESAMRGFILVAHHLLGSTAEFEASWKEAQAWFDASAAVRSTLTELSAPAVILVSGALPLLPHSEGLLNDFIKGKSPNFIPPVPLEEREHAKKMFVGKLFEMHRTDDALSASSLVISDAETAAAAAPEAADTAAAAPEAEKPAAAEGHASQTAVTVSPGWTFEPLDPKKTYELPAGDYFVGDMPRFDDPGFLNHAKGEDFGQNEGDDGGYDDGSRSPKPDDVFQGNGCESGLYKRRGRKGVKAGVMLIASTDHGDGIYKDSAGRRYGVDGGVIAAISSSLFTRLLRANLRMQEEHPVFKMMPALNHKISFPSTVRCRFTGHGTGQYIFQWRDPTTKKEEVLRIDTATRASLV